MSELGLLVGGIARLLMMLGGGVCAIMVGYAGIMWMMSGGDPQGMAKARMALFGALGGLLIVGLGFILPRVVSETVVEPSGGFSFDFDVGVDCDSVLQGQLVFQRAASDADRMNMVVREVQVKRVECAPVVWNPFVDDAGYSVVVGHGAPSMAGACFSAPLRWGLKRRWETCRFPGGCGSRMISAWRRGPISAGTGKTTSLFTGGTVIGGPRRSGMLDVRGPIGDLVLRSLMGALVGRRQVYFLLFEDFLLGGSGGLLVLWIASKWERSEGRSLKVRSQGLQWNVRAVPVVVVMEMWSSPEGLRRGGRGRGSGVRREVVFPRYRHFQGCVNGWR